MYDGEWTIGTVLATRAEQQPDREIVRFEDEAVTYGGLDETANRVANALGGLGLVKGDRVADHARQPARVPRCSGSASRGRDSSRCR